MSKFITYKIDMRLLGRLTQIPDSQKIFGSLIYMYSENSTAEEASKFVAKIKNKEIYFSLSNMMPRDYLPAPQNFLLNKLNENNKDCKEIYKKIKKRQYMKSEDIFKSILEDSIDYDIYPYVSTQVSQQIHASIDSLRYNMPGLDSKLYSVPEITILEVTKEGTDKEIKKPMNIFSFYIAGDDSEEFSKFISLLKEAEEDGQALFLGARSSQGLNTFVIEEIAKPNNNLLNEKEDLYLNLGMLIPNSINFNKSTIKLFTSERRPYNGKDGWNNSLTGKFISFVDIGSVIHVDEQLNDAGKCIESPFNSRDIIFGNSFLLPLTNKGGRL